MNPILYEINTRCWLRELSDAHGHRITLANVPDDQFACWQRLGFTHIWLMGVWSTGPKCRKIALAEPNLIKIYEAVLPDWQEGDISGSPYAIADYKVPRALGGEAGLAEFRNKLYACGLRLMLDFVPNHFGLDHSWLRERPDLFVQSPVEVPGTFAQETVRGLRWLANGKDPHFLPWNDTVQLDYRRSGTRAAMQELLLALAARCDGVRCDMAMLLLNEVFANTWKGFPCLADNAETQFWLDSIAAVKRAHPEFLFLAEVYWDLETRMQKLGFDYTYDKGLYDELFWRNATGAQRRLLDASREFIEASAHFLENHDEPRIAGQLSPAEHRAAALVTLGLPGMRFLHEGQLRGARIKIPVQLARRPIEPADLEITKIYDELLAVLQRTTVGCGQANVLSPRTAWTGNSTAENFIIVQWQTQPPEFDLVVANLSSQRSQCYAPLSAPELSEHNWSLRDLLGPERYGRFGADLAQHGLYLDVPAHGAQIIHFEPGL